MTRPVLLATMLMLAASPRAEAAPANTLQELYAALNACLTAPGGIAGSDVTLMFSLRRNGTLIGSPRTSHRKLPGHPEQQKRFVADAVAALGKCLPLPVTDGLGGAIAGTLFSIRIGSRSTAEPM